MSVPDESKSGKDLEHRIQKEIYSILNIYLSNNNPVFIFFLELLVNHWCVDLDTFTHKLKK